MDVKLENLIEKIKKDGVDEAKIEADEILRKAKEESDNIIQASNKQAAEIIEKARKEAEDFEEKSKRAIKLAARDTELLVKENLMALFNKVFRKEVSISMSPDFLQKLILQIVSQWENKKAIEIMINEEDKSRLEALLFSKLKDELKESITLKISEKVSKGFHIRMENENLYYDISQENIAEILNLFLNQKLKAVLES
jgi:V/A-type H+-transporting ATPase subunit E